MKGFDWSLVLLVEDLLVHDWVNNDAYMIYRTINPDKIVYAPQIETVMRQLSTLEGEALEAYTKQQRHMVQDSLNVLGQITSLTLWLTYHTLQFIRRYNTWEVKRQAERASEDARRKTMYGFRSSVFPGLLQILASTRGWKPSATIGEI